MNNHISLSFYNSDEADKSLEKHFTKLIQKEMGDLKSPGSIKDMKFKIKMMIIMMANCFHIKKTLGLHSFTGETFIQKYLFRNI